MSFSTVIRLDAPPISSGTAASPTKRVISRWELDIKEEDVDVIRAVDWDLLQALLLRLDQVPTLAIQSKNESAFRWVVQAVGQGSILAPALRAEHLELRWIYDSEADSDRQQGSLDILSAQSHYLVDDMPVALNPVERFELELRSLTSEDAAISYLRTLLSDRSGNDRTCL
ncbi:hypothetical protein PHLGIDRAFT_222159 [Phlebiopsis gigantea 11061_1 CR5-6]|uniref:Uncharacterized protein n=1 Tax=Phlebiopsis gigantea (strain 11061_1 CR5-6) TaxID=745531 RepID=A0A0C3PEJ6_PHLG1|nr:hypothetical protein PHLGIDRAFT_222159 [Phlebiopsis gigantea 11061_1 CR5-6]